MLLKGFYKLVSTTKIDTVNSIVRVQLQKDHPIFKGHFPENPITPGVCMIQIIKEITQIHTDSTLFLESISNVKFTAIINPFENPELLLEMQILEEDNTFKVKNLTKFENGVIALKCNGIFIKK
jgi:3-hydroxyacyl-[acyl-carrier-protein] dehydratase